MRWILIRSRGSLLLLAVSLASCLAFGALSELKANESPSGERQASSSARPASFSKRRPAGHYFIEFRSRLAQSYGHTFAVYGRANARGQIIESRVAGLHPAGNSSLVYTLGHLFPVPAETGASEGDLQEEYVSARYKIVLGEEQYRSVAAYIRQLQAESRTWNAIAYNCNAFVADIARYMGLRTPSSTLLMPADFVNRMRELN